MKSICVVGSGIIGLSSAVCVARKFHGCKITIVYEKNSPQTTSDHSFGMCSYRSRDETDGPHLEKWTKVTQRHCAELVRKYPRGECKTGVVKTECYAVHLKSDLDEAGLNSWIRPRLATKEEVEYFNWKIDDLHCVFDKAVAGNDDLVTHKLESFLVDNMYYLPWMMEELQEMKKRGEISQLQFLKRRIDNFSDLLKDGVWYDCIINCSGMGSSCLVPDNNMVPIRGQYLLLEPKGEVRSIFAGHAYVCRKVGRVAIGSTHQIGRDETDIDENDTKDLLSGSAALYPESAVWRIIKEDVGIRPSRYGGPRVEVEFRELIPSIAPVPIVHNYGHGSKGVIQHWGCAVDVAHLLANVMQDKS